MKIIRKCLFRKSIPLSLGVETKGGFMAPIIQRGSPFPNNKSKNFFLCAENQSTAAIKIFEGENTFTEYNNLLGEITLKNIPAGKEGLIEIEVNIELDTENNRQVKILQNHTGNNEKLFIPNNYRKLSTKEIVGVFFYSRNSNLY
jgi:molecular chaperone DnaK